MRSNTTEAELNRYIGRAREIPVLERDEEYALALKARRGDRKATDKLVSANLRYVVSVALQYRRYGIPISDLISEGNVGLMVAVRKFEPERGNRFITYAGYWVRAFVLDLVVKSARFVGGGSGPLRSKLFFKLRRERARAANLSSDLTEQHALLAERLDIPVEKVPEMLQRLEAKDVSLDAPGRGDSDITLLDMLVGHDGDQEHRYLEEEHERHVQSTVQDALKALDERERYILERRFWSDEERSLASIGRELGVSRERVRQLEARAKGKIRQLLDANATPLELAA